MTKKIQAIRGMNDLLPSESNLWSALEETINSLTDNLVKNVKKYSERIEELNKEYKW